MSQNRVKMAVIGAGHWGPNLIRNFYDDPRVELKLLCDMDKARAIQVASRYRNLATTSQMVDAIHDPEINTVVICTPTNTHFEIARECLLHNKDVFIEKPMATTSEECETLIDIARRKEKKLMVGHVFLFNPAVQYVRELIQKKELGEIIYVYGKRVNLGPIRKDVNALWDLAPHDIAILNYWMGEGPILTTAAGTEYINPPLHDVVFVSLKYPNNVLASLHVSWLDPRKIREIVVVGTKKMVVFDDLNPVGPVHIYDKTVTRPTSSKTVTDTIQAFKAVVQEGDLTIPKIPAAEPLKNECKAFIDWLVDEKEPVTNGYNGLDVVRVLEAATHSLQNRGTETLVRVPGIRRTDTKPELSA